MDLRPERTGNVTVIRLSGKLDTDAAQALRDQLYDYCGSTPGHTILDLTHAVYVSSYLIGVLVGAYKRLAATGSQLHLVGVHGTVQTVLAVSGLEEVFPRHESLESGIAHFNAQGVPA